jgi:hypothetical protein
MITIVFMMKVKTMLPTTMPSNIKFSKEKKRIQQNQLQEISHNMPLMMKVNSDLNLYSK